MLAINKTLWESLLVYTRQIVEGTQEIIHLIKLLGKVWNRPGDPYRLCAFLVVSAGAGWTVGCGYHL